ncbi:MAG: hypothetical protein IJG37_00470 [Synergistaceae bacterium]|nr:hypothetical protein [Synergistaceae bacterium]MBQ7168573.1 hypothetical protein [Synergistaceae bacterium]
MGKFSYEKPEAEVTFFGNEDVITASGNSNQTSTLEGTANALGSVFNLY